MTPEEMNSIKKPASIADRSIRKDARAAGIFICSSCHSVFSAYWLFLRC